VVVSDEEEVGKTKLEGALSLVGARRGLNALGPVACLGYFDKLIVDVLSPSLVCL
jgi:hypothetical protein